MRSATDDVLMTCACADDVQVRMTCVDDVHVWTTCVCGRNIKQLCIKPTGLLVSSFLVLQTAILVQLFSDHIKSKFFCLRINSSILLL